MNYLLKMVEGPMKGAEIALVPGTRVKVGSADACDVVVADASLPDVAFELDVTDSAVTLILPDGDAKTMHPFEIQAFGTTEVAIGPAEGTWEPLTRPAPPAAEAPAEAPAEETSEKSAEGAAAEEPAAETPAAPEGDATPQPPKKGRGLLVAGALALLAVLLLAAAVVVLWFWPHVRPLAMKVSAKAAAVDVVADRFGALRAKCFSGKDVVAAARAEQKLTLGDLAGQNGLKLDRKDGRPLLKGNLKLRTERLAVRALALACDRTCLFDLTDDESLRASADSLLFLVTEGAIQVAALTNRVATLKGFAAMPADLSTAVRALIADVPGIEKIVTTGVKTGGSTAKSHIKKGAFPETGRKPSTAGERPGGATGSVRRRTAAGGPPVARLPEQANIAAPEARLPSLDAPSNAVVKLQAAVLSNIVAQQTAAVSNAVARQAVMKAAAQAEGDEMPFEVKASNGTFVGLPPGRTPAHYPSIAGILTVPYPCVVLANGMRCVYGAHLGGAEIVDIRADAITLIDDGVEFVWVP